MAGVGTIGLAIDKIPRTPNPDLHSMVQIKETDRSIWFEFAPARVAETGGRRAARGEKVNLGICESVKCTGVGK